MRNLMYKEKFGTEEKGINSTCVKCGTYSNPFSYHDSCYSRYGEHLHYSCQRCGYDWTGNTLDNQSGAE